MAGFSPLYLRRLWRLLRKYADVFKIWKAFYSHIELNFRKLSFSCFWPHPRNNPIRFKSTAEQFLLHQTPKFKKILNLSKFQQKISKGNDKKKTNRLDSRWRQAAIHLKRIKIFLSKYKRFESIQNPNIHFKNRRCF